MENLCDDCYRNSCMLHPDNAAKNGNIIFRMIECPNQLTDDDAAYEVHVEGDTTILFDNVPTGGLTGHLNAIKKMVKESLEDKEQLRDALAEIVYLIINDEDYQFAMGEMGQLIYKYSPILEKHDISIE
jgi:hypothetical protein